MAIYQVNYQGLRKRSDYDELVDFILFKQPKIKYPNRTAKFIRESPQLSNLLDGEGMGIEALKQQQFNKMKEEQKQHAIIESASESGGTAQELRSLSNKSNSSVHSDAVSDYDGPKQDYKDDVDSAISDEEAKKREKENKYSSMFVNDPGHDLTRRLEDIMSFNLDFTPAPSVSSGNGNGNGNSGNISDTLPAKEASSSALPASAYPSLDPPAPAKLVLIPPGRNQLEPSSSSSSAYPSLNPPAPMPQINNRTHELLDMLFRMNEEELREYAKNNVGLKPRSNTSKDTLIGNIVIAQLGPPSAPPIDLLKKEIKRRRRIDTPIPQSPPNY